MTEIVRTSRWHLRAGRRQSQAGKGHSAHVPIGRYMPGEARSRHCSNHR